METSMPGMSSESVASKPPRPVWDGIRLFLADAGFSSVLGFVIGVAVGATTSSTEAATGAVTTIGLVLGLLVSAYSAFLLYRNYSQSFSALAALSVSGLVYGVLSWYGSWLAGDTNLALSALMLAVTIAVYALGWYLAKTYTLKFWLPGRKTVLAFTVVGGIIVALSFIGLLGLTFLG